MTFTNTSTGAISSYAWDFDGDGVVDSTEVSPPPFTYITPGVYTASLTVYGMNVIDIMTVAIEVNLLNRPILLDFDPRRFDRIYIALDSSTSAEVSVLKTEERDYVSELLEIVEPNSGFLLKAVNDWRSEALTQCNAVIPDNGLIIPEYDGSGWIPPAGTTSNQSMLQSCWIHTSVLAMMRYNEVYVQQAATYNDLIAALIWQEMGSSLGLFCNSGFRYGWEIQNGECDDRNQQPAQKSWFLTDEGVSRQMFSICQRDGCQSAEGNQFELYRFLNYFQPARQGKLSNGLFALRDWSKGKDSPQAKSMISMSVETILDPPLEGDWSVRWTDGLEFNRPYGFATDLFGNQTWLDGRRGPISPALIASNTNGCTSQSFAFDSRLTRYPYPEGRFDIFFATAWLEGVGESCRFGRFYQSQPSFVVLDPGAYRAR